MTRRRIKESRGRLIGTSPRRRAKPSTTDRRKRSAGGTSGNDRPHRTAERRLHATTAGGTLPQWLLSRRSLLGSPQQAGAGDLAARFSCNTLNRHRMCHRYRSVAMAPKPMIGVNVDYRSSRKDSPAFCFLHAGYCDSLHEGRCCSHADSADGRRSRHRASAEHVGRRALYRRRRSGLPPRRLHASPVDAADGSAPRGFRPPTDGHGRRSATCRSWASAPECNC